jgi:fumarate hydratase class II
MHVSAALEINQRLLPSMTLLRDALDQFAKKHPDIIKIGRTHLQVADTAIITAANFYILGCYSFDIGTRIFGLHYPTNLWY